jgi:hypothetical protein
MRYLVPFVLATSMLADAALLLSLIVTMVIA